MKFYNIEMKRWKGVFFYSCYLKMLSCCARVDFENMTKLDYHFNFET